MTPLTAGLRVEFDQVNKISLIRVEAPLTQESLQTLYEANQKHCSATNARVAIVDLSSISVGILSSGFVQRLANQKPTKGDVKCLCFIVAPAGYVYGLCRMFQIWGGSRRPLLQVVHTLGEVFAAIGIRSALFEPSVVLPYSEPNNPAPIIAETSEKWSATLWMKDEPELRKCQPSCLLALELVKRLSIIVGYCDLLKDHARKNSESQNQLHAIREIAKDMVTELTDHRCQMDVVTREIVSKQISTTLKSAMETRPV